jgi:tetratricopeptide (TPR) repeat protein
MKVKSDDSRGREEQERKQSLRRIKAADRRGHVVSQLGLCKEHLRRFPDHTVVWFFYGQVLAALFRFPAAERAFARALKLGGRKAGRYVHAQLGLMYDRAGDHRRALRSFEKVIRLTPEANDATHHVLAGHAAWKLGLLRKAERHFRTGTACKEGSPDEAWFNLAGLLLTLGRYGEAADCYERTLSLCPRFPLARRGLRDLKLALEHRRQRSRPDARRRSP